MNIKTACATFAQNYIREHDILTFNSMWLPTPNKPKQEKQIKQESDEFEVLEIFKNEPVELDVKTELA